VTEDQLKRLFLSQRQALPLTVKIEMTKRRIHHWYELHNGNVHVSFSGGADSTVLLHIVRMLYPDVPAVFVDTGMEYPEIREFVRTVKNVRWMKPKKTFKQVCSEYGYPIVSKETSQKIHEARSTKSEFLRQLRTTGVEGRKRQEIPQKWKFLVDAPFGVSHKCCYYLKKEPSFRYEKETGSSPYVGTMASESSARLQSAGAHGCFIFGEHPSCRPFSFWTPEDTHRCLALMPHCVLYDPPYNFPRTGCMLCAYGAHLNNPNKFQMLKLTHPRIYEKAIPAFGLDKVLTYAGIPY
jgi:3'-phosphoadenosine 5'-phosphosulfate sulfotransferase (PAPS reductase)/FAD synthetase